MGMLIPVAGGVLLVLFGVIEWISQKSNGSYFNGRVSGVVMSERHPTTRREERAGSSWRIQYRVRGKTYEETYQAEAFDESLYWPGKTVVVNYNKEHPEDFTLQYAGKDAPWPIFCALGGLALIVLGLTGIVSLPIY
jgi:hypothetical protein